MYYLLVEAWPLVVFQSLSKSKQIQSRSELRYNIVKFLTLGNKTSLSYVTYGFNKSDFFGHVHVAYITYK